MAITTVLGNYSGGISRYDDRIKWSATTGDEGSRWRVMYEKVRREGRSKSAYTLR